MVITQNGKPRVVVIDAAEHDRLQDTLAMLKLLSQSVESFTRSRRAHSTADARRRTKAVFDRLRRR